MQIVLWDPFLIKKLLKSVICWTFTMEKSNVAVDKKKKKVKKHADTAFSPVQTGT